MKIISSFCVKILLFLSMNSSRSLIWETQCVIEKLFELSEMILVEFLISSRKKKEFANKANWLKRYYILFTHEIDDELYNWVDHDVKWFCMRNSDSIIVENIKKSISWPHDAELGELTKPKHQGLIGYNRGGKGNGLIDELQFT